MIEASTKFGEKEVVNIETFYLIDYENVHGEGLSGCQDLGKTDHIVIFFTQNAKSINMSAISDCGSASLEMIEVPAGKQSADMHIGSYLGYLAGKNGKNCGVVIVSKDTDFDKVIKFWRQKTGIAASRTEQIKKKTTQKKQQNKKEPAVTDKTSVKESDAMKTKLKQEVMQAVKGAGYAASVANTVSQIAEGLYGDEKMVSKVSDALEKRYSNYLDVYASVKPVLSKYAGGNQPKNSKSAVSSKDKTTKNSEIQKIMSREGFSSDVIDFVASTVVKNLSQNNGKQMTYRAIIKKYGQGKGLTIYNHIKKHF